MQTILTDLYNKLRTDCGSRFKRFHVNDPWMIPKNDMPCLIIASDSTDIAPLTTPVNDITHNSVIIYAVIVHPHYKSHNQNRDVVEDEMVDLLVGVDGEGNYRDDTVMGSLRSFTALPKANANQTHSAMNQGGFNIQYKDRGWTGDPRDIVDGEGIPTREAVITIENLNRLIKSNRI